MSHEPEFDPAIAAYYGAGVEASRLEGDPLERLRTEDILARHLPPPPARVLDVGGGPGVYARWLAARGYDVRLVDPVPLHVRQALETPDGKRIAGARVGDARRLDEADASVDAVLLLGPLYHLSARADRVAALSEARRVTRPGGVVVAAVISRFASTLDGLRRGILDDPEFAAIAARDLRDGVHLNPTGKPEYFTTAYFHRPEGVRDEASEAGLETTALLSVEGPAWLLDPAAMAAKLAAPRSRDAILDALRKIESEPSLVGASAHVLLVARPGPA